MSQIITNLDIGIKMPPIDISAPREIETLTCAMDVFWGRTAGLVQCPDNPISYKVLSWIFVHP